MNARVFRHALLLAEPLHAAAEIASALTKAGVSRVERRAPPLQSVLNASWHDLLVVTPSAFSRTDPEDLLQMRRKVKVIVALSQDNLLEGAQYVECANALYFSDAHRDHLETVLRLARANLSLVPDYVGPTFALDRLRVPRLSKLSRDELAIMAELSLGQSNAAIARDLGFQEREVKSLVRSALAKLAFRNRTEAGVFALRHSAEITAARQRLGSSGARRSSNS